MKFWGPYSKFGLGVLGVTFALDQLSKWWILKVVNLDERQPLQITPFLDLAMAWNEGVSYSLFSGVGPVLLFSVSIIASIGLWIWLAGVSYKRLAWALSLIIGGALGNGLDRILHGAVADFVHLHWGSLSWYVFNLADVAIVAGVGLLLYDSFFTPQDTVSPDSKAIKD